MNHRTRLKRQDTLRVSRQSAAILFVNDIRTLLDLLPQWRTSLEQIGIAAETASAALYRLSAMMGTLRNHEAPDHPC